VTPASTCTTPEPASNRLLRPPSQEGQLPYSGIPSEVGEGSPNQAGLDKLRKAFDDTYNLM